MKAIVLLLAIAPIRLAVGQSSLPPHVRPATASIDSLLATPGPAWLTGKSSHLVLHLERPARGTSVPAMLDSLERAWKRAVELLGTRDPSGVQANVFVTASRTRFSGLVTPDNRGLTTQLPRAGKVVFLVRNDTVRAYVQHEVMHVASRVAWGPPRPTLVWLDEGLATFADGRCQNSNIRAVARDLLSGRQDITAEKILNNFVELQRAERATAYVFAGTLVDYLWATRGREGVRRVWQGLDTVADVGPLPGAGGELTAAWREHVARVAGTTAGIELASLSRAGCG